MIEAQHEDVTAALWSRVTAVASQRYIPWLYVEPSGWARVHDGLAMSTVDAHTLQRGVREVAHMARTDTPLYSLCQRHTLGVTTAEAAAVRAAADAGDPTMVNTELALRLLQIGAWGLVRFRPRRGWRAMLAVAQHLPDRYWLPVSRWVLREHWGDRRADAPLRKADRASSTVAALPRVDGRDA